MPTGDAEVTGKVEAVMARVRASISSTDVKSGPGAPSGLRTGDGHLFPDDLYRSLHQARTIGGGMSVDYALGWRTPIIGHLWMIVRQRIHQEIRIYVDALTTQQSNLNTHLVRALTHVVETLDGVGLLSIKRQQSTQAEALIALEDEIRRLREQVAELQERIDGALAHHPNNGTSSTERLA